MQVLAPIAATPILQDVGAIAVTWLRVSVLARSVQTPARHTISPNTLLRHALRITLRGAHIDSRYVHFSYRKEHIGVRDVYSPLKTEHTDF